MYLKTGNVTKHILKNNKHNQELETIKCAHTAQWERRHNKTGSLQHSTQPKTSNNTNEFLASAEATENTTQKLVLLAIAKV